MNRILHTFAVCLIFIYVNAVFAQDRDSASVKNPVSQITHKSQSCTIKVFRNITRRASMKKITKLCGKPDGDIGSGIHIYIYKLADGSEIRIGTPDNKQIMYVIQVTANGKERYLLKSR
jgi:hypothetical protein